MFQRAKEASEVISDKVVRQGRKVAPARVDLGQSYCSFSMKTKVEWSPRIVLIWSDFVLSLLAKFRTHCDRNVT